VRSRTFLPVVAGAMLILTLFFAAVAGAQETASPEATTSTADANQEARTADSGADGARGADSFRCDFFLRQVSDDRGALLGQYRGNELIVQRFEQCLSGDVLVDTIPNRNLPFTGGMPLLGLAALGLVALIAGAAVLRAVMRRAR
jgi:hypothetical protein